MIKKAFLFSFFFFLFNFAIEDVYAQPGLTQVCTVVSWIKDLLLTIGILSLIFGGYKILTAGGDPGRMEDAKKIIIIALVGMAVIWGIITLIKNTGLEPLCA